MVSIKTTQCLGVLYLVVCYSAILVEGSGSLSPLIATDHMTTPTISPFGNLTLTPLPPMSPAPTPLNHSLQSAISNVSLPATLAPMPTAAKSNVTFGPMPTMIPVVNQTAPVLFPGANGTMGNSTATPIILGDVTMPHASQVNASLVPGMTTAAGGGGNGAPAGPAGPTTPAAGGAGPAGPTGATTASAGGHGLIPALPAILPIGNGTSAPGTTTAGHGAPAVGATTAAGEHGAPAGSAGPTTSASGGHGAEPGGMTTAKAGAPAGPAGPTTTAAAAGGHGLVPALPAILPLGNATSAPGTTTAGHGAPGVSGVTAALPVGNVTLPTLNGTGVPTIAGGTMPPGGTTAHGAPGMTSPATGTTTGHGAPPTATLLPGLPTLGNLSAPGLTTIAGGTMPPLGTTGHGAPAAPGMTTAAGAPTTTGHGASVAANGTMAPGMTTTVHGPPAVTLLPGLTTIAVAPGMTTAKPAGAPAASNATMAPGMTTTGHGAPAASNGTAAPGMTTTAHGAPAAANGTMAPGMTTTAHGAPAGGNMTTTQKPLLSACGATGCLPDEVCLQPPFNASQTCARRRSDRRYCVDNPCPTGMKCFDNATSQAYTCFTKLDGTAGECLGIQCSPGDICYQVMGQQAKCIQMHQAPRCLGQNEEFSPCKSGCESTCAIPTPPCMNSTTCTSGCACIRGYVRMNGVCELMSKCPSTTTGAVTCSGTEQYVACKPACEKTCSGVPSKTCQLSLNSTTIAPAVCTPGCTCRSAYKRDTDSGQCVHSRQCFQTTTCGLNESWSRCHNCEAVCGQTANPSCKTCWSGCGCNPGFSRSTAGLCVETAKCA